MIKLVFSFVFTTIWLASNAQFNPEKDPFLVKSLKGESFQKINAQTTHGNISVSSVPAAEFRIETYVRASSGDEKSLSKEEIQVRLDENYTLEISVSGGQLSAIAKQKNQLNTGKKSLSISFKIFGPENASSILKTSHGNVTVLGLTGSQDIATSHGNLSIEKVYGKLTGETSHGNISVNDSKDDIELRTSHGNIDVKKCEGTIKLTTSNGDVQLANLKGNIRAATDHGNVGGEVVDGSLSATTSHGNVDLRNLSCSVEGSTSHGNISVLLNQLTGPVTLVNSQGNISLQLPKGKGVNLDLDGKAIRIETIENFSGSQNDHAMKGSLNGGGVAIKATTGKGTVSLSFK